MSRGIGEIDAVASLPDAVSLLAALVTALGDVWFVFFVLGLVYWFGSAMPGPVSLARRRAAAAIAFGLGGLAITTTLKGLFGLPRPPGAGDPAGAALLPETLVPLYAHIGAADGFGFPSGHAIAAVVVYGGLALLIGTRRGYTVAAMLAVLIPLSRILLGVHYLVDVVAGVAVGAVFLAVVYQLSGRGDNPGRAMFIAVVIALVGAAMSYSTDTMLALGGAIGARMAWGSLGRAVVHETTTRTGAVATIGVGAVFGLVFATIYALDVAPYIGFITMFVVIWGVLGAPLAGEAIARRL